MTRKRKKIGSSVSKLYRTGNYSSIWSDFPFCPALGQRTTFTNHLEMMKLKAPCEVFGSSSLTISAKPDGAGAAYQLLIPRGERSGLRTRTDTESVSSCAPMKS